MRESVPKAIEELQMWLARVVTHPVREMGEFNLPIYPQALAQEIREKITAGPYLSAEERVGIYNQQYWWRFFVLLQQAFPTLVRLFGYRDFNTLIAEPYLLCYPTNEWFLPYLGKDLVRWLREKYWLEDRELIIQAAMLDMAYEELFHVEEKKAANDWKLPLFLQPIVAIFAFSADFHSFRAKLLEQEVAYWQKEELPKLDNSKGKYYLLLYRTKEGLLHEELREAEYQLLAKFGQGVLVDSVDEWLTSCMERGFFSTL